MPHLSKDLYHSPNGDSWRLIRVAESGRLVVRHEPNQASGGHVSDVNVADFLKRGGSGPEYVALRQLLSELGEDH